MLNAIASKLGRTERSLERLWLTPDGQYIAFTAHDGTIVFVSNKASIELMCRFL